jgi:hypothetical protein
MLILREPNLLYLQGRIEGSPRIPAQQQRDQRCKHENAPLPGKSAGPSSGSPNSRPAPRQGTSAIVEETENSTTFARTALAVLPFMK